MSSADDSSNENTHDPVQNAATTVNELVADLQKAELQSSDDTMEQAPSTATMDSSRPSRPIIYTRKQLLHLSNSPLVKVPDGMPSFASWFGELNEQTLSANKKEAETVNGSNGNGRDRRYRRDPEDGEASSRPSFRSVLSQPSQMGNFKHQPLRGSDRDRDRDRDDLRTLSDKFDRDRGRVDRLGIPANSTLLRNRDRDSAPHLAPARETGKKRNAEGSEDSSWRRGAEPNRQGRDDHHPRRERDDRDRPRSRARDGSRQRDSPPSTRRERDDKERERPDRRERERDREDHRKEPHDFGRKDRERFDAEEDSRRWRDDGKREERMAGRRDKDRDRNGRDRDQSRDTALDKDADQGRDRELREGWSTTDDRGAKRGGRERRLGGDEGRDRDREDRRERERDKEPAWMETYVPSSSSPGILGGKVLEGEVDSIQAWKKDMKEKEAKAKGNSAELAPSAAPTQEAAAEPLLKGSAADGQLDEIQIFKMLMKKEEQKKAATVVHEELPVPPPPVTKALDHAVPGFMRVREARPASVSMSGLAMRTETPNLTTDPSGKHTSDVMKAHITLQPPANNCSIPPSASLNSNSSNSSVSPQMITAPAAHPANSLAPRLLQSKASLSSDLASHDVRDVSSPTVPFDPPRQSRLLAFGAKANPSNGPNIPGGQQASRLPQQPLDPQWSNVRTGVSPIPGQSGRDRLVHTHLQHGQVDLHNILQPTDGIAARASGHENTSLHGFAPYETAHRQNLSIDGGRDLANFSLPPESTRSSSMNTAAFSPTDGMQQFMDARNRNPTPPTGLSVSSPISPYEGQIGNSSSVYSAGKGSRMAKHFEKTKTMENQVANMARSQNHTMNTSGLQGREQPGFNLPLGSGGGGGETRNIADLLTMLSNSAQVRAGGNMHTMGADNLQRQQAQRNPQLISTHGGLHQNMPVDMSHQPQHNHHIASSGRQEPIYDQEDSRFASNNLVPGLRSAHRNRDLGSGSIYQGQLDESLAFGASRLSQQQHLQQQQQQQQRSLEQLYSGPISPQFANQGPGAGRNMSGFQQPPLRGGPSPISSFNAAQAAAQQRLPPGLANLGGRPPHEPSQFMGNSNFGLPAQALHGGPLHATSNTFNQFQNAGLGMLNNPSQMRGAPNGLSHVTSQMGNTMNGIGGLGGVGAVEFRGPTGPTQNQLMGLGVPGMNAATRGGPGFTSQHVHAPSSMSLRQQQSQHLPPQMMMPPQMHGGQPSQNDLMALLMGGAHRE